ncbi:MAG: protein,putative collagen-binding protein,Calx-beta, partial [Bacteroidetes bacterium]|nr:protein,putative collagen-binding protein,Calx-beta [Bacteroidota bacterium]
MRQPSMLLLLKPSRTINGKTSMKHVTLSVLLAMTIAPALGFAQQDKVFIPFNGVLYQYQFVKSTDTKTKTFSDPTKTDATIGGWATTPSAQGAWGTLNKPGTDPCPLNIADNIKITWPSGRDVLIRRWIDADSLAGASNVRITVAIDNAVIVYWNNQPVYYASNGQPAGRFTHDVCATETSPGSKKPAGDVTFTIPNDYLDSTVSTNGKPQYLLAVRGVTLAEKSYLDIKVVADFGYKLTTNAVGPGKIDVSPVKDYYQPTDKITLKATVTQTGYFFGRGQNPATLQTGWDGVPFAAGADTFANPVTFSISRNTTVTGYFSPFPNPQDPINVSTNADLSSTGGTIEGSLRWALEKAEKYPGPDEIIFPPGFPAGPIKLDKPLSAADLVIINQTGNLITLEPRDSTKFGTGDAFELPGVFVNWGYSSGGITISGLRIQRFPGPGLCINSNGNTVQGCEITLNGGDGICIEDGNVNTIRANKIFANKGRGVSVSEASISDTIPPPSGNRIQGNSIYANSGLGIDLADRLGGFGVTTNRYLPFYDSDGGKTYSWNDFINRAQHYPDLEVADPQTKTVKCRLYAPAGKSFSIELFREPLPNDDEKATQQLLSSTVTDIAYLQEGASGSGVYAFELITLQAFDLGDVISATATDENGNTSEFSPFLYAGVKTRVYGPVEHPDDPSDAVVTNRWVANTTFRGQPLHWPNGVATLSIAEGFPDKYADTASAAMGSSGPWSYPGSPLTILKDATPGPFNAWGGVPDGANNVVYTKNFTGLTGAGYENALAISRVRYNSFTGEIFDADVLINGGLVDYDSSYVFAAVFAHELGHAVGGLGDIYDRNDQPYNLFMGTNPARGEVTMYGIVRKNENYQTTVHPDDKEGLNYIFGNVLPSNVDLALLIDASQSFADPAGYGGFTGSVAAAMELVDRLREGDGIAVISFQGNSASVPAQFERIGPLPNQSQKDLIKSRIAGIMPALGDDRRAIGSALKIAVGELNKAPSPGRRAGILFSAGNETESPSALDYNEVLQKLGGANPVRVFTMGFGSPEGDNLGSKLADATGGLFYETNDTTISPNTNHAWEVLTGQQLLLDYLNYSGENQAISYKGS